MRFLAVPRQRSRPLRASRGSGHRAWENIEISLVVPSTLTCPTTNPGVVIDRGHQVPGPPAYSEGAGEGFPVQASARRTPGCAVRPAVQSRSRRRGRHHRAACRVRAGSTHTVETTGSQSRQYPWADVGGLFTDCGERAGTSQHSTQRQPQDRRHLVAHTTAGTR